MAAPSPRQGDGIRQHGDVLINSPQSDAAIQLDSVTLTRGGADLLSDISWSVGSDERWVVLGPNGAGKTT
ncbi:MAG: hypothetical protein ACRD3Q_05515, partial [Terriglobales bacterium]